MKYKTIAGEMIDEIVAQHYGFTTGAVEAVLAANPGLAALGPVLSGGVIIHLPHYTAPKPTGGLRLWD